MSNFQVREYDAIPVGDPGHHPIIAYVTTGPKAGSFYSWSPTTTAWTELSQLGMVSEVSETATTSETSSTDVLVDGMSITPAMGTYLVFFTGTVRMSTNPAITLISIYSGGVRVASSERQARRQGNIYIPFWSVAKVTVNGSQAIEGQWNVNSGTTFMEARSIAIKEVQ